MLHEEEERVKRRSEWNSVRCRQIAFNKVASHVINKISKSRNNSYQPVLFWYVNMTVELSLVAE